MANKNKNKKAKPAARKSAPKKSAARKSASKKPIAKKAVAKKPVAQKAVAKKKTVVKKGAAKTVTKKIKQPPKVAAKKALKVAPKKATAKPAVVKAQAKATQKVNVAPLQAKVIDYSKAITPLLDRLVVRVLHGERVTAGGLIIPDTVSMMATGYLKAEVVAVGHGGKSKKGNLKPLDVQVGDHVLFSEHAGTKVEFNAEELQIIHESDVMGILQSPI